MLGIVISLQFLLTLHDKAPPIFTVNGISSSQGNPGADRQRLQRTLCHLLRWDFLSLQWFDCSLLAPTGVDVQLLASLADTSFFSFLAGISLLDRYLL